MTDLVTDCCHQITRRLQVMTNPAKMPLSRVVRLSEVTKPVKDDSSTITNLMTIATPFDDDGDESSYKWSEIRDRLGLNSNVANARWMPEKIMPLFANLKAKPLLTDKGKPTKFCAQMLFRYKAFCVDGEKDYELFCGRVRSAFGEEKDDGSKPVPVEVLFDDDETLSPNDDRSSSNSLTVMQHQLKDKDDDLESMVVLALQTKQQADQAEAQYQGLSSKSWEQQIVEDELAKFQEEQERKKREFELRAKVRQMLEQQNGSGS